MMTSRYPETKRLANEAFCKSGSVTIEDFRLLLGGVGRRTLARWLAGEGPAGPLATMVFRNMADGWKPKT